MPTRLPNWENRLNAEIAAWRPRKFNWRTNYCTRFAAACVEAITGEDMQGDDERPRSKAEAETVLAAKPLAERLDAKFERIPAALAQRGDLAMMQGELGVVIGGSALFWTRTGLDEFPRSEWSDAWAVGR